MSEEYKNKKMFITAYEGPDLDGYSCAYAYTELLRRQGVDAVLGIFGEPDREVGFVLNTFGIHKHVEVLGELVSTHTNIVLCDASTLSGFPESLDPGNVVELIDHRKAHEIESFSNAKVDIQMVGAAATLVAERFFDAGAKPTEASAVLLYSAIISNTINFHNNVTTDRDKKMAEWLKNFFHEPGQYIEKMFSYKSDLSGPIGGVIEYAARFEVAGGVYGVSQIEAIDVWGFVHGRVLDIEKRLSELKEEKDFDHVFLTCVDIKAYQNIFVCFDGVLREVLEEVLGVSFENNIAKRDGILMRKEIIPLVIKGVG